MTVAGVLERNNVAVRGGGTRAMVFAHGYGCDQNMWRYVAPAFEDDYRVVLFDHVGAGRSDLSAYDRAKYASLQGYADDVLEICRELELRDAVFVGHSVSAMIGVLAAAREPDRFGALVLQCTDDVIAPLAVGEYVHRHVPESELVVLSATGHCPNLSAPEETTAAIRAFLSG